MKQMNITIIVAACMLAPISPIAARSMIIRNISNFPVSLKQINLFGSGNFLAIAAQATKLKDGNLFKQQFTRDQLRANAVDFGSIKSQQQSLPWDNVTDNSFTIQFEYPQPSEKITLVVPSKNDSQNQNLITIDVNSRGARILAPGEQPKTPIRGKVPLVKLSPEEEKIRKDQEELRDAMAGYR